MNEILKTVLATANQIEQDTLVTYIMTDKQESKSQFRIDDDSNEFMNKVAPVICSVLERRGFTATFKFDKTTETVKETGADGQEVEKTVEVNLLVFTTKFTSVISISQQIAECLDAMVKR